MLETRSFELEFQRKRMFRWRKLSLRVALPLWLALTWIGFKLSPAASLVLVSLAQFVLLVPLVILWSALYRFASEAGSPRYALGQLLLAIFLTPFLFAGMWAIPILVASDADKGVARRRAQTAAPLWFVALDTLVVFALLGLGIALVAFLGILGLFLAALAVPLLYKVFRVVTQGARP